MVLFHLLYELGEPLPQQPSNRVEVLPILLGDIPPEGF
jgi:hypothetical protein